jgi:hypothetical protein
MLDDLSFERLTQVVLPMLNDLSFERKFSFSRLMHALLNSAHKMASSHGQRQYLLWFLIALVSYYPLFVQSQYYRIFLHVIKPLDSNFSLDRSVSDTKLLTMHMDAQTIITLVALLVSCPPTIWLLYTIYAQRQLGKSQSKTKISDFERWVLTYRCSYPPHAC